MINIKSKTDTKKVNEIMEFMDGNSYNLEEACRALDFLYDDLTNEEVDYINDEMIMCERCLTYSHLYDVNENDCEVCINNKVLGF